MCCPGFPRAVPEPLHPSSASPVEPIVRAAIMGEIQAEIKMSMR
jgi:hypothetical protein